MSLHFVIPKDYAAHLDGLDDQIVGESYPHWVGGRLNWAAQTYLMMRQHFEGVSISLAPKPGIMNFGHCMAWRGLGPRQGEYRISVRADYPRLFDVDYEILQNPAVSLAPKQAYFPYWPVPGIIPRDPGRTGIQRVAYAGRIGSRNLADPLKGDAGSGAFEGLEFAVIPPDQWHDMSKVDLLIAIRSFDTQTHDNKPPSKLFNAWNAGIPLIGGYDSAFSAIAEPGVEYLRVETEDELNAAVLSLRENDALYRQIVEAGARRRNEITHDSIAENWCSQIDGVIRSDFEAWKESGGEKKAQLVKRSLDVGRSVLSGMKSKLRGK